MMPLGASRPAQNDMDFLLVAVVTCTGFYCAPACHGLTSVEDKVTKMDTSGHDDAPHEHYPTPQPGRTLTLPAQGLLLACFAGALLAGLFVLPAAVGLAAPSSEAEAAPPGSFKPTDQQWAGLRVLRVTPQNLAPQVVTEGRIALDDDVSTQVFSPYTGRVTRVIARAGDVVAAGAPLFGVLSTELAQAQNDLISALATLKTARAQLGLATVNEKRQHTLFMAHGAAEREWQQSRVDLATAEGGVASGEIAVAAVRNRLGALGMAPRDIRALEGAGALEMLSADTIVRAPIAGTVTQRQINPGQNIVGSAASAGAANAVYTIGDLRLLWLVANAPEPDAPAFHVGDTAHVSVPAYPGRVFTSRITFVSPVIDPATHRLLVRGEIANPDGALKPDMLANFEIVTGQMAPVIAVPASALVYEGSDAHVWVADPATKSLALRPVSTGLSLHGVVEILDGLKPGESVVTSGAVFIDRTLQDS
jgi:cobalt-zinc-cadmium efflux system membrane fusion protein